MVINSKHDKLETEHVPLYHLMNYLAEFICRIR